MHCSVYNCYFRHKTFVIVSPSKNYAENINFELDKNLIHTTNCHLLYQVAEHLDFAKFAIISDREGLSFGSELLKSCLCLYIMLFQKAKDLQFLVNTWNTTFSFSVMSP